MLLSIRHTTSYRYSKPVFFEPTTLRLRPRNDCLQHVLEFSADIDPKPSGMSDCVDLDGNDTTLAWFTGTHEHLTFTTTSLVQTFRTNPFDYTLAERYTVLPFEYQPLHASMLFAYRQRLSTSLAVGEMAQRCLHDCEAQTLGFLTLLTRTIHQRVKSVPRNVGDPLPPDETLLLGHGACRDIAALWVDACRAVGLAARMVSGYIFEEQFTHEQELHAWGAVYLPGAGWRAFDPTIGLAVADHHVALAAGPCHLAVSPIDGIFRGTGVASDLDYKVIVEQTPTVRYNPA